MAKLQTLEEAVSEFNVANPKTPLMKKLVVPTLSFKILQSDNGESIDSDSWQVENVTFKVLPEAKLANSFLTVRRSKQADRGYELVIYRHQYIDADHGWAISGIDMTSSEEGLEISRAKARKITASQTAKILNDKTKLTWLRFRNGNKLEMPAVSTFQMER
ncbi:MAG: hypothetical protein ABSA75_04295 [Candidatus Bathyarchaeia archaeon]|jgi:hypothetical protein